MIYQEDTIEGQDGSELGRFVLPTVCFSPKGVWVPHDSYRCFDLVSFPGQVFCCIRAHRGGEDFKEDFMQKHWVIFLDLIPLIKKKTSPRKGGL